MVSIFQDCNRKRRTSSYLVTEATIHKISLQSLTLEAMMDSGSLFNIFPQVKVKEIGLADDMEPDQKPRTIDGHFLQIFLEYAVFVMKTNFDGRISQENIQVWQLIFLDYI